MSTDYPPLTRPPDHGTTRPCIGLLLIHVESSALGRPVPEPTMRAIADRAYKMTHWQRDVTPR